MQAAGKGKCIHHPGTQIKALREKLKIRTTTIAMQA